MHNKLAWTKMALEKYSEDEIKAFEEYIPNFQLICKKYILDPSYENEMRLKHSMVIVSKEFKYLLLSEVPSVEVASMLGSIFYLGNDRNNLEDNWPNYWSPGDKESLEFLKEYTRVFEG